jgi:hypothetical protein
MDLLMNWDTNDLLFQNGACPVTTTDFNVVGQRLRIRLLTFQGEYNFNTNYGVPYFQRILGKRIRKQDVDNIFQQIILQEVGVREIINFTSTLINKTYNLTFTVRDDKGALTAPISLNINI